MELDKIPSDEEFVAQLEKEYKTNDQLFNENKTFWVSIKNVYLKKKLDLKRNPNPEFENTLDEFWIQLEEIFRDYEK